MSEAPAHEISQATLSLQSQDNTEIMQLSQEIQDKYIETVF